VPSKADPEKQSDFLKSKLKPAIEEAKKGKLQLFFVDASHFVMGGSPGRLWGKVRQWVRTGSGRKRFSVLGAMDFVSKKIETVTNAAYITATQVVELMEHVAEMYSGLEIAMVMDKKKKKKCALVMETAARLGVQLIFLPTYSPNLNLIERVWKFVKARVLNARYIDTFPEYCQRISEMIDEIDVDYYEDMKTLVSEKLQTFDKCKVL
jgi:transposase